VHVRLDRVQVVCWAPKGRKPPTIEGFEIARDSFVRCQTTTKTYARCRQLRSLTTAERVFWQYQPLKPWLSGWKITLVADDKAGLSRLDIEKVLRHCRGYRFLLVEIAIDFARATGIGVQFVREHGHFGKSRLVQRAETGALRYGCRKSSKLVRCYSKAGLNVFRVELELHGSLLRNVANLQEFPHLARVVYPRHLRFVAVQWRRLERYLLRRFGGKGTRIARDSRRQAASSLQTLLRFLKTKGVPNAHRFLVPLSINQRVFRALHDWARRFNER
jgi:hypothetical protein